MATLERPLSPLLAQYAKGIFPTFLGGEACYGNELDNSLTWALASEMLWRIAPSLKWPKGQCGIGVNEVILTHCINNNIMFRAIVKGRNGMREYVIEYHVSKLIEVLNKQWRVRNPRNPKIRLYVLPLPMDGRFCKDIDVISMEDMENEIQQ